MAVIRLPQPEIVAEGLTLPEAPRWHDGAFYSSDIFAGRVMRLGPNGLELVAEFPGNHVSGLGFMPNGDLLTVLMDARLVMRTPRRGQPVLHADLTGLTPTHINDMVVDTNGRAYVSQPGYDMWAERPERKSTDIIVVEPDGRAGIAASGLHGPNGLAIGPDGKTLFVAESGAGCISAFAIATDGSLSDQRLFAQWPEGGIPDGICLDEGGGVWAAIPVSRGNLDGHGLGVQRIVEGGTVTHTVPVSLSHRALACVFGGSALHICTVDGFHPAQAVAARSGRIERVALDFRGAGLP